MIEIKITIDQPEDLAPTIQRLAAALRDGESPKVVIFDEMHGHPTGLTFAMACDENKAVDLTPAAEKKAAKAKAKQQETPAEPVEEAPPMEEPKKPEPQLTLVDVRAKATEIGRAKGTATVKEILKSFNCDSVSTLPKEEYRAFMTALEQA